MTTSHVSKEVRIVHLKGSTKPYRNIPGPCMPLKHGGIGSLPANNGSGPLRPLSPVDDLLSTGHGADRQCVSRDMRRPVRWLATQQPLARRCCSFVNLVKAEWWRMHRLLRAEGVLMSRL